MARKSLFLILLPAVYASNLDITFLRSYDIKTCQNEPSCDLVDDPKVTADRRTLRGRPCMCDPNCVTYRDCCTDSKYYNELEQSRPPPFSCQSTYKVYWKTTCPETWIDEEIKSKCILSTSQLRSDDTSLVIPVTNTLTNITYGNKHCALCHGETEYISWVLTPKCGEAPAGLLNQLSTLLPDSTTVLSSSIPEIVPSSIPPTPLPLVSSQILPSSGAGSPATTEVGTRFQKLPPVSVEYYILSPTSRVKFRRNRSVQSHDTSEYVNPSYTRRKRATKIRVNFVKYTKIVDDIWKTAKYDPYSGYFVTKYSDKDMICVVSSKLPSALKPHTRVCVPNTIEVCQEAPDPDTEKQCRSHTSLTFNKRTNKAYRNKYCATCDGVEFTYLTGCPIIPRDGGVQETITINL